MIQIVRSIGEISIKMFYFLTTLFLIWIYWEIYSNSPCFASKFKPSFQILLYYPLRQNLLFSPPPHYVPTQTFTQTIFTRERGTQFLHFSFSDDFFPKYFAFPSWHHLLQRDRSKKAKAKELSITFILATPTHTKPRLFDSGIFVSISFCRQKTWNEILYLFISVFFIIRSWKRVRVDTIVGFEILLQVNLFILRIFFRLGFDFFFHSTTSFIYWHGV